MKLKHMNFFKQLNLKQFATLIVITIILAGPLAVKPISLPRVSAQPEGDWWQDSWLPIGTDPNEAGGDDYRDIQNIYVKYDTEYLYLKLTMWDMAGWGESPYRDGRYSCYFDVDSKSDPGYIYGNNVRDVEYKLFLEDNPKSKEDEDGLGEMYLIKDLDGSGEFLIWEVNLPSNYRTNGSAIWSGFKRSNSTFGSPVPSASAQYQMSDSGDLDSIGFRIENRTVYIYVSWGALGIYFGVYDFGNLVLFHSTDHEENNLNSAEYLDSPQTTFGVPFPRNPSISLQKYTNGYDANDVIGPSIPIGQTVEWTYNITNTGNDTLANITLVDDREGPISLPNSTLASGESMTVTVNGTATIGQYSNVATVSGEWIYDGLDVTVYDSDPSHYFGVDLEAPVIESVANVPEPPLNHLEPTLVLVNASDNIGVERVTIEWPGSGVLEMAFNSSSGLWEHTIPGYAANTNFSATVTAYDSEGNSAARTFNKWWIGLPSTISGGAFTDDDGDGSWDLGEPGIAGVNITLAHAEGNVTSYEQTATDSDGRYSFIVSLFGAYTVTSANVQDMIRTTPETVHIDVQPNETKTVNFGYVELNAMLGVVYGTVFNDTDSDGLYGLGEQGIPGVEVSLYNESGLVSSFLSDTFGQYLFSVQSNGTYTIVETDPTGYVSTTPNSVQVNVTIGGSSRVDFGDSIPIPSPQPSLISGLVFNDTDLNGAPDAGEVGLGNISMSLHLGGSLIQSATTDVNGSYSFIVNEGGSYTVTETDLLGWNSTTPNQVQVNVTLGNSYTVNFGDAQQSQTPPAPTPSPTPPPSPPPSPPANSVIRGVVFNDADGDGVRDSGELGIPGVTVSLYLEGSLRGSVTTSLDGSYSLSPSASGIHVVVETDLPGWISTTPNSVEVNVAISSDYVVDFGDARDQVSPVVHGVWNDPEPPLEHMTPTIVFVNASDNVGIADVTLEWPGSGVLHMTYNSSSGFWEYTIPGYAAGTNFTATVIAFDAAGNSAARTFDKWWVDVKPPEIVDVELSDDAPVPGEDVTVTARVIDDVAVARVVISHGDSSYAMTLNGGDARDGYWMHVIKGPVSETSMNFTIDAYDSSDNNDTYGPRTISWVSPEITLWPSSGYGDTTLYGRGFTPYSPIKITWNDGSVTTTPSTVMANEKGEFTAMLNRISMSKGSGNCTVKAADTQGRSDTAYFNALAPPQGPTGSAGQPGQDLQPGYIAGLLLLVIVAALLASMATSRWVRRRGNGADNPRSS